MQVKKNVLQLQFQNCERMAKLVHKMTLKKELKNLKKFNENMKA